jgi:methionine-gamma-lyase
MPTKPKTEAFDTLIVHGLRKDVSSTGSLVPPIHMSSTFRFDTAAHGASIFDGSQEGYVYTRIGNPTVDLLQEKAAALEGGEAAVATASGMAAVAAAALSMARPGDNFLSCSTVYGGTFAFFDQHLRRFDIEARFISPSQSASKASIISRIDQHTRFLYVETPANPTLAVVDIALWADIAHQNKLQLVVDNTFATPYLQTPLKLGADLVIHSATKYLGGHADLVGGLIVGNHKNVEQIRSRYLHHFGPILSPFNAWLLLRGIKTLAVRMQRHCANARQIARYLEAHPQVDKVFYPGLPSHSEHALACSQMRDFGGMLAFEIAGGLASGKVMMDHVRLCTLAVSLGDCDSLIQHPASMTHATYSPQQRMAAGISDGLIRLSVGIEDANDIIADLERALAAV